MIQKSAVISKCGEYRYFLRRHWDDKTAPVTYVMLNPSTADAEIDDATIRSCCRLARDWGYGGIRVVNLFAYRATKPSDMLKAADPIGPENDDYILDTIIQSDLVICAWGAQKGVAKRAKHVLGLIAKSKHPHCLGTTKAGHPKHPLYIKTGTTPQLYQTPGS